MFLGQRSVFCDGPAVGQVNRDPAVFVDNDASCPLVRIAAVAVAVFLHGMAVVAS